MTDDMPTDINQTMKILLASVLLGAILVGCTSHLPQTTDAQPTPHPDPALPFKSQLTPPQQMSKELLFNYLAGEIALKRKDWPSAYTFLFLAAKESKNAEAASRATRIGWKMGDMKKAWEGARLWTQIDPNDLSARHMAVLAALGIQSFNDALAQARAALQISSALNKQGYLLLASALANYPGPEKLTLMLKLSETQETDAEVRYATALVATQLKKYDEALALAQSAHHLNPGWDKPYLLMTQIYASRNQLKEAENLLASATKKTPTQTLIEAYARVLIQQQKHPQALSVLQRALKTQPDNEDFIYSIGLLALRMKDWPQATQSWTRLLNSSDHNKKQEAHYFLGQTLEQQSKFRSAIDHYEKVEKEPMAKDARLRSALLKLKLGDEQGANTIFNQLRLTYPDQAVQFFIIEAQAYQRAKLDSLALQTYSVALLTYPDNPKLRYAYAMQLADTGDINGAEKHFKWILEHNPNDADALNALGYTLANDTDRFDEAYQYISKALKLEPDSPAILDSMGWVLYRMGKPHEALAFLQKAAARLDDGEILAHLAEVLWALGRQQQALDTLNDALSRHPDNSTLLDTQQRLK